MSKKSKNHKTKKVNKPYLEPIKAVKLIADIIRIIDFFDDLF